MALVSDLINQAMSNIGGYVPGEGLSAAEQADAFARLNQMIDSWSREQLTLPNYLHTGFALTAGVIAYTLGTGGALVTTGVPLRVTGAHSVSGAFRSPCRVISFDQFSAEVADPLASSAVLATTVAADGSFPSINIKVFPVPAAAPGTLFLDYWQAIAQFATVGDTINLPSGWQAALQSNLAIELYPQYARTGGIDPVLAANAQKYKGALVALNAQILGEQQAPAGGGQ